MVTDEFDCSTPSSVNVARIVGELGETVPSGASSKFTVATGAHASSQRGPDDRCCPSLIEHCVDQECTVVELRDRRDRFEPFARSDELGADAQHRHGVALVVALGERHRDDEQRDVARRRRGRPLRRRIPAGWWRPCRRTTADVAASAPMPDPSPALRRSTSGIEPGSVGRSTVMSTSGVPTSENQKNP